MFTFDYPAYISYRQGSNAMQEGYLRLCTELIRCPVRQLPDVTFVEFPIMENTKRFVTINKVLERLNLSAQRLLTKSRIPYIMQVLYAFFSL
jgi:hypothetical protein